MFKYYNVKKYLREAHIIFYKINTSMDILHYKWHDVKKEDS